MPVITWILPLVAAWFIWGFWGFLPKQAGKYIGPIDILLWEVVGAIVLGTLALCWTGFRLNFHPTGTALSIAAGFCGYLGTLFFLFALRNGPVSLVVPLSALYPVCTIVLAVFVMHEPITVKQLIGIAMALASVVIVSL